MVSYEIAIGVIILCVLVTAGSLNLSDIVRAQTGMWYIIPHFPMFMIFIASILAETNRHPFDLPEDEASLVTGYNVEYSSMAFALLHFEPVILPALFVLAVALCGLYRRTGSLLPGFVAHAAFNSSAVLVMVLSGIGVLPTQV